MKTRKLMSLAVFVCGAACAGVSAETAPTPPPPPPQEVAQEWRAMIEPLLPLAERIAERATGMADPQLRNEMYQFVYSQIAQGFMVIVNGSADYPDFMPYLNNVFNTVDPNPDDVYYVSPLDAKGTYRISGYRGKVNILDFSIGGGNQLTRGEGVWGQTFANYDANELKLDRNGYFEVILSAERPSGHKGNWWKLPEGATNVNVRQISSNWADADARIAIERLDVPAIRPRPTAAEIQDRLKQIAIWAENWPKASLTWIGGFRNIPVNTVTLKQYNSLGGITTQTYIYGKFALAADEALIYETEVPKKCRYWALQLNDELFRSIDWVNRQSALNDYTARRDSDGKFRAVISAQDPGVPNWLDNAGYTSGAMFGRWHTCSSTPQPTITKVKVADVRKYLPRDTPVVTAQERDQAVRKRRELWQIRKRW